MNRRRTFGVLPAEGGKEPPRKEAAESGQPTLAHKAFGMLPDDEGKSPRKEGEKQPPTLAHKGFGEYMANKITKLREQFDGDAEQARVSDVFRGVTIFVNGLTSPTHAVRSCVLRARRRRRLRRRGGRERGSGAHAHAAASHTPHATTHTTSRSSSSSWRCTAGALKTTRRAR